jgi:hypothetical protein
MAIPREDTRLLGGFCRFPKGFSEKLIGAIARHPASR